MYTKIKKMPCCGQWVSSYNKDTSKRSHHPDCKYFGVKEVCPTCKLPTHESFHPTKHGKVKARYGPRNLYWNANRHRPTYLPAFKAKVNQAPPIMRKHFRHKTSMKCSDPWHDEQIALMYEAKEAEDNAPTAEEQRQQFLVDQKKRKEESAQKRKAKARLHKERQRKK